MSRTGSKTKLKGKAAAKESPATDPVVSCYFFRIRDRNLDSSPSVAIETYQTAPVAAPSTI